MRSTIKTIIARIYVETSRYEKWENVTTGNGNLICVLKGGHISCKVNDVLKHNGGTISSNTKPYKRDR